MAAEQHESESGDQAEGQHAGAHRQYLERGHNSWKTERDLTVDADAPANVVLAMLRRQSRVLSSAGRAGRPLLATGLYWLQRSAIGSRRSAVVGLPAGPRPPT